MGLTRERGKGTKNGEINPREIKKIRNEFQSFSRKGNTCIIYLLD